MKRLLIISALLAGLTVAAAVGYGRREVIAPPVPASLAGLDPAVRGLIERSLDKIAARPRHPMHWMELALVYEANGLGGLAERCYLQGIALEPGIPQSWYHLALVRDGLGDREGALEAMSVAAEMRPDYAPPRWRLGYWMLESGDAAAAEAWFRRGLAIDAGDHAARFGLARARLDRGDAATAMQILESIIDEQRGNEPYARLLLAEVCRRAGIEPPPDALAAGVDARPVWRDPWAEETRHYQPAFGSRLLRAVTLMDDARFDEALPLLRELHELRPDDVTTVVNLGAALRATDHLDEARRLLDDALAAHPDHFALHLNLASTCFAQRRYETALAHADRAVALNGRLADAHETRGLVLIALGRWEDARQSLQRSLELAPSRITSHLGLAEAQIELGQIDGARRSLDRAAELAPGEDHLERLERRWRRRRGELNVQATTGRETLP